MRRLAPRLLPSAVGLVFASCTSGPAVDAGGDVCPGGETLGYLIDSYEVTTEPAGPDQNLAPGFDLDGRTSVENGLGTCVDAIGDYVSPATGEASIDNQLTGVLHTTAAAFLETFDLEPQLEAEIANGTNLLSLQISGVDDLESDTDVCVELLRVTADTCPADACPVPDVRAPVRWRPRAPPIAGGIGQIDGGVLDTRLPEFPLVFTNRGRSEIPLRHARLRCTIHRDALSNCTLGGALAIDDLVEFAEREGPGIGETIRGLLEMYADLSPSATDPLLCTELSAGLELTAIAVSITGP